MPKRTGAKIDTGSFDQPNMQLLNDYRFVFFYLVNKKLGSWWRVIYCWEGNKLELFNNIISGWSKLLQLILVAVLFGIVFY
jgi:hypothetical protein